MSLTRMSSRPCSARMRSTSCSTCSGTRWSTWTAIPLPPAAETSSAVSSMVSGRRIRIAGPRRSPGHVNRRARRAEFHRNPAPRAARSTRDQSDLSFKGHEPLPNDFSLSRLAFAVVIIYKRLFGYKSAVKMPRPKTLSDENVLEAALAIIHERGPEALTFASLARDMRPFRRDAWCSGSRTRPR